MNDFRLGLYMHFKGKVYCAVNIVEDCTRDLKMVQYFDVNDVERGYFVRPVDEWFSTDTDKGLIKDREDNATGQSRRFEPYSVGFWLFEPDNYSTELLMKVLSTRKDSPLRELDIEGVESTDTLQRDWCFAIVRHKPDFTPYVGSVIPFDTKEEAVKHYKDHYKPNSGMCLLKRIYLKEEV